MTRIGSCCGTRWTVGGQGRQRRDALAVWKRAPAIVLVCGLLGCTPESPPASDDVTDSDVTDSGATDSGATDSGATDSGAQDDPLVAQADSLPEVDDGVVLTLPEYPWWDNDEIEVSEQVLLAQATAYCASGGESVESFLYGYAARDSVDRLCNPGPDDPSTATLLGNLYVSGYLGGVWFGTVRAGGGGGGSGLSKAGFQELVDNAAMLMGLASEGEPQDVFAENLASISGSDGFESLLSNLLVLYAYNQGYVEAVTAAAPASLGAAEAFSCAGFLDCAWADAELASYAAFRPSLKKLESPSSDGWKEVAGLASDAESWVSIGTLLWSDDGFDEDTYALLIDINAGYLLVTASAALGSLTGYADQDEEAGRCALLLEAATDTWNSGYFAGVTAPSTADEPSLTCPAD